jgi:hypothetical protein
MTENATAQAAFGEDPPKQRASRLGYVFAGLVAIAAVGGAIAWFVVAFTSLGDKVDELHRIEVPGSATIELDAGDKAVYWEGRGASPPLRIAVLKVDGEAIDVGPHGGEVTYEVNGHNGTSIAGFEVPEDGRYVVSVEGRRGLIAVGDGVGGRIVSAVVGGLAIFFGGLLLCGLLLILTARRRRAA